MVVGGHDTRYNIGCDATGYNANVGGHNTRYNISCDTTGYNANIGGKEPGTI